ncbi:SpoIIAA family protein [Flavobacterium ardleyense]|uniref:STAS/SEC14 domain-containing protein n=1 Tax=Flavobacterium ardleyense TaxID=2038737 RepID=UPI00298C03B5|nr:STAS/SEC14 domain-containing protein [Flavobacterium ardleyense]
MIQQITDLPENMVGFRASGEVIKDDFDIVLQKVEEIVEKTGKLNYLLYLETSPANFTIGAWVKDGLLGVQNLTKWNRAAIVSDSEIVKKFTDVFSDIMPGEFRGFEMDDLQHAIDWTSEKIDK